MGASKRGAGLTALVAVLALTCSRAGAAELVVLPYACTIADGQPVLIPGPEQGHRILGQRDQRQFTACSPVNPDMCRTWTVHRFDLDCDGERAPWVSVMAATREGSRRAWLLDGRFVLRMGPRWSLAPDDPCANVRDEDEWFGFDSRMRRRCADRLAMAPPPVVKMPFGYAPMLGIDAIFVEARPREADEAPPPLPPIVAGPAPAGSASADKLQEPPALSAPPAPVPAPKAARLPRPAPDAGKTAPEPKGAPPQVASTAKPPAAATLPSRAPRVREAPSDAAPAAESRPAKPEPASGPAPKPAGEPKAAAAREPPASVPAASPPPSPRLALRQVAPRQPATQPEPAFSLNLLSLFRASTTGLIVVFAGLALGLIAAFALARRREHARDAAGRRRDISSLFLDGKRAKPPRAAEGRRPRPAPRKAAATSGAAPAPSAAGRIAEWGDRMPRTREEALEVLGIGISPSANEAAIKKIVDGLRMSWHPDHAKDETDRALRELRSKQINAAWDLLQTQRTQRQRAEV